MIRLRFLLLGFLAIMPSTGLAQSPADQKPLDPKGYYARIEAPCTKQPDGTCIAVSTAAPLPVAIVSGGGGGGGGSGDASASNQTTQITAANLTNTRLGDITAPAAGSVNARLEAMRALLAGTLAVSGPLTDAQLRATALPISVASLPLPTGAATAANQATGNASLATIAGHVGATGSASPSTAAYVGGVGPNGNLRGVAVDTRGGLVPGQGVVASTRTTLTASTATLIGAAGSTRVGVTVQVEAALTANLHICSTQTTSCSATSYDFLIPSGATAGTSYTFLFATTGTIYAFSTGTPVVVLNSWTAQ